MAVANLETDQFTRIAHVSLAGGRCRAVTVGLLLFTSIAGLSGCHLLWPFEGPGPSLDNVQFMDAWKTYLHCRSSTEPDEIHSDLHRLKRVEHAVTVPDQVSVLLPDAIRSLMTALPSRLAVDPKAMVVACELHGGHVAQSGGQPESGVEPGIPVVTAQRERVSAHYAGEAGRRLNGME
jgi:hypothetical protein